MNNCLAQAGISPVWSHENVMGNNTIETEIQNAASSIRCNVGRPEEQTLSLRFSSRSGILYPSGNIKCDRVVVIMTFVLKGDPDESEDSAVLCRRDGVQHLYTHELGGDGRPIGAQQWHNARHRNVLWRLLLVHGCGIRESGWG